jgi:hypothetical protein
MTVSGETHIAMLNISQRIPTINDLLVLPCSANIVIRTMAPNKIASTRRKLQQACLLSNCAFDGLTATLGSAASISSKLIFSCFKI